MCFLVIDAIELELKGVIFLKMMKNQAIWPINTHL